MLCTPAGAKAVHVDYAAVMPKLAGIRVPVILPQTFDEEIKLYSSALIVHWDSYLIGIWDTPDCNDVMVCRLGHMEAGRPSAKRLTGTRVYLKQFRVYAYYVQGPCGFGCQDSTLAFELHGFRYVLGIKGSNLPYIAAVGQSLRLVKTPPYHIR